jgi:hypothetical protein
MRKKLHLLILPLVLLAIFSSCKKEEEIQTKQKMEGCWTATSITNAQGQDITNKVSVPIVAFHLSSDGTIISTAGPLITYVVYGDGKYTQIASQIDQVFNYATLSFNGGEFFVGSDEQKSFTLEMKLEGISGTKTLKTMLQLFGIESSYLEFVVYHKFLNVGVEFADNFNTMIWTIDGSTTAAYNKKDTQGNYLLWNGWPVNNFQHCTIRLAKQIKDIRDVVSTANASKK